MTYPYACLDGKKETRNVSNWRRWQIQETSSCLPNRLTGNQLDGPVNLQGVSAHCLQ
jgi:hypothetical protein